MLESLLVVIGFLGFGVVAIVLSILQKKPPVHIQDQSQYFSYYKENTVSFPLPFDVMYDWDKQVYFSTNSAHLWEAFQKIFHYYPSLLRIVGLSYIDVETRTVSQKTDYRVPSSQWVNFKRNLEKFSLDIAAVKSGEKALYQSEFYPASPVRLIHGLFTDSDLKEWSHGDWEPYLQGLDREQQDILRLEFIPTALAGKGENFLYLWDYLNTAQQRKVLDALSPDYLGQQDATNKLWDFFLPGTLEGPYLAMLESWLKEHPDHYVFDHGDKLSQEGYAHMLEALGSDQLKDSVRIKAVWKYLEQFTVYRRTRVYEVIKEMPQFFSWDSLAYLMSTEVKKALSKAKSQQGKARDFKRELWRRVGDLNPGSVQLSAAFQWLKKRPQLIDHSKLRNGFFHHLDQVSREVTELMLADPQIEDAEFLQTLPRTDWRKKAIQEIKEYYRSKSGAMDLAEDDQGRISES